MMGWGQAASWTDLSLCGLVLGVAATTSAAEEPGSSPQQDRAAAVCASFRSEVE